MTFTFIVTLNMTLTFDMTLTEKATLGYLIGQPTLTRYKDSEMRYEYY